MRRAVGWVGWVGLLVLAGCRPAGSPKPEACPTVPLRGVDIGGASALPDVAELGHPAVHYWLHWDAVEPELGTVVASPAEVTDAMVEAKSAGVGADWSAYDEQWDAFEGYVRVPAVGSGYLQDLPWLDGSRWTPDRAGRQAYLGTLSLYARAAVRRYRGRAPLWQVENEVNVARLAVEAGIREGELWADDTFADEVIEVLTDAVRLEDPAALVTTNLHTDIEWEEHVLRWAAALDWIGLDAYPNYLVAEPLQTEVVAERVERALELADGRPVVVLETGYPSAPAEYGFTEALQAEYFRRVVPEAEAAGACGTFYFKLRTDEELGTEPFPTEDHWGMFRSDDSKKPVWEVMHEWLQAR